MKKMPDAFTNDAKRVRIGIFEYLLGLQYTYLCNKKLSKNLFDLRTEKLPEYTL